MTLQRGVRSTWSDPESPRRGGFRDLAHSLEIVDAQDKPPVQALEPAFPKAETPDVKTGIKPSQKASFTFKADKPGEYWIMCGVPGHALGGMWDKLIVSDSATTPSVSMQKAS